MNRADKKYWVGQGSNLWHSARYRVTNNAASNWATSLLKSHGMVTITSHELSLSYRHIILYDSTNSHKLTQVLLLCADHFTAKLSVRMINGPDFVATNFTFFDCNTYSSCTQCVSSLFPCDWCVDGHRCTHDTAENCRNDILVTGVSVSLQLPPFLN